MKLSSFPSFLLLALLPLTASATPSDPVGALRLKLLGGSDTIVSLPLHRPSLVEARISLRATTQLTLDATVPSLPADGAYLLVMSGALEGAILPVTAIGGDTLSVDAAGYDLSALTTGISGDLAALIPYWTLDTVFPDGASVQPSTNRLLPKTEILLFSEASSGVNQASSDVFFYFAGNGTYPAGWYRFGNMTQSRGHTPLVPNRHFIVRHPAGAPDTELLVTGAVQVAAYRVPIRTLAASQDQDNLLALPVPVPITLDASQLFESGAFASSPNRLMPLDELLVFDNNTIDQNKAASSVYFYFAGNGSYAAGWYRFGDMAHGAGTVVLKPGEGFVIRKYATATPERLDWNALPPYLQ